MKRLSGLIVVAVFVAAGCNRAEEPAAPAAPAAVAHGNLAQVMQAIPFPASNIIFDTQTTDPGKPVVPGDAGGNATAQFSGVYGGWLAVENAAIALQETANLILIPGRLCGNGQPVPTENEDFRKWAQGLADAGAAALKAAQAKDLDAMIEVSGTVSDACAACHEVLRDTPDQPKDRCMVGQPAAAAN